MKLLLFLHLVIAAFARPSDLVSSLPGYDKPLPVEIYSGFLNATAADPAAGVQLHYMFYKNADPNAPVVLWLNGGPGSSSLLGAWQEWGPLLINKEGEFSENPYAWTHRVNVIALESPAGTYSRAKAMTSVRSESYAGVYVPTLTSEILQHAPEIKIKGIFVGDPCTSNQEQQESMDMLWYGHKHGFVPDEEFDLLWNTCRVRHPHPLSLNLYKATPFRRRRNLQVDTIRMGSTSKKCIAAKRKYLLQSSKGFSQTWRDAWINNLSLFGTSAPVDYLQPGTLNYNIAAYMMRRDVMKALHVESTPNTQWPGPSSNWIYTKQYDACNDDVTIQRSMISFYREIAPQLKRTIVFNGDTDPCVSYEGTRAAIKAVGFNETEPYRPYFFNATASTTEFLQKKPLQFGPSLALQDADAQFGGHVVNYEHNLSFMTVHGAGHMVPTYRPRISLHMLDKLISNKPFAASVPSDEAISEMSDTEFSKFLNDWTEKAKLVG
eukprot:g5817.t1